MKIVELYNIKLEREMEILLVVIIQGYEMSAGFHCRGWILGIHSFRLTGLDVYHWPNG